MSNRFKDEHELCSVLPPPPIFKQTFIQMQRASSAGSPRVPGSELTSPTITTLNSNYLTSSFVPNEEYSNGLINHSPSISPMTYYTDPPSLTSSPSVGSISNGTTTGRKRRRSSQVTTREDMERKRRELKTQHSIIEKKRRIKMNREFEALKFLVPACRANILAGISENNYETSSMMHKLTILQSTVEYIKYLHLVIKLLKLQMLTPDETRPVFQKWFQRNGNLKFVDFDLDLQSYRQIEHEFNFEQLFVDVWNNDGEVPGGQLDPVSKEIESVLNGSRRASRVKLDSPNPESFKLPLPAIPSTEVTRTNVLGGMPLTPTNNFGRMSAPLIRDMPKLLRPEPDVDVDVASQLLVSLKGKDRKPSIQDLLN